MNKHELFGLADCNNFYASCERVFRPKLRGKPVIVLSNNDGCVIARSNEAKTIGIQMGQPYFECKKLVEKFHIAVFSSNSWRIVACWPAPREEHWLALLRARAIENQCFVAAANRCGRDPSGLAYGGRSQIIDPRGVVLADGGVKEGVGQVLSTTSCVFAGNDDPGA